MKSWLDSEIKNFDIIHMHNFRTYQNYIVSKYAKKNGVPYILQARGSVLPFFQKQTLKKIYDIFIGFEILNNAEILIALTEIESNQYEVMGIPSNKIKIIPNGISLNMNSDNLYGNFKRKYDINDDEKIILYLGRIHKIKGIDLLVKSFKLLSRDLDKIKLIIDLT